MVFVSQLFRILWSLIGAYIVLFQFSVLLYDILFSDSQAQRVGARLILKTFAAVLLLFVNHFETGTDW